MVTSKTLPFSTKLIELQKELRSNTTVVIELKGRLLSDLTNMENVQSFFGTNT